MEYSINDTGLIDSYSVDVGQLYSDRAAVDAFRGRLQDFLDSDPFSRQIVSLDGDALTYQSESYLPATTNPDKPTLVFLLGNPAPESIAIRALFAYENSGKRYHRFWNVLESTGVLRFDRPAAQIPPDEKMGRLFSGEFESAFNIWILPFYSFSTPPGGKWGGVAGVKRLFGRGFPAISDFENERVGKLIDTRLRADDTLLVFQRDAYTTLGDAREWPAYDYRSLLSAPMDADWELATGDSIHVKCVLPTRLLHSAQTKGVLSGLALAETKR